jgi:hypothetical protein
MRNKRQAKRSKIPKSIRLCPQCKKQTTFGYTIKKGHSCCTKCGHDSKYALFVRWCNPRQVMGTEQEKRQDATKEE